MAFILIRFPLKPNASLVPLLSSLGVPRCRSTGTSEGTALLSLLCPVKAALLFKPGLGSPAARSSLPDPHTAHPLLSALFFLVDEKLPDGSLALLDPWIICAPAAPAGAYHWDSTV